MLDAENFSSAWQLAFNAMRPSTSFQEEDPALRHFFLALVAAGSAAAAAGVETAAGAGAVTAIVADVRNSEGEEDDREASLIIDPV